MCYATPMDRQICPICNKRKLDTYRRGSGLRSACWLCRRNPETTISDTDRVKSYQRKLKFATITHYGNECACCGEKEFGFLCLDHINGGGNKHRKEVGSGAAMYRWIRDNGYPKIFQVMCHNCNQGRQFNGGICPHKMVAVVKKSITPPCEGGIAIAWFVGHPTL